MALTHAESRSAPLGSSFKVWWHEQPCAQKRRHSCPTYAPHHLLSPNDLVSVFSEDDSTTAPGSPTSQAPSSCGEYEEAGSHDEDSSPDLWPDTDSDDEMYEWSPCRRRRVDVPGPAEAGAGCHACDASVCISVASEDDSTTAPESPTSQAPSSCGEHEHADSLDEGGSPDLWPDTESDDEIYDWSPCRRRVVVPASAEAWAGCHACRATVCISAASEDDSTTAPGGLASQAPSSSGEHEQADSLDEEVDALGGAQGGGAQRRYQAQRKKQQRQAKKRMRREEALTGEAEPRGRIVSL